MRRSWPSSGCQKPSTSNRAVGLACRPSIPHVQASNSSSRVPAAPGSATNASASSPIRALRSCIVCTTSIRGSPGCASSSSTRCCGITPTTSPPAASAASATTPISPTCPPPYTTPIPARARSVAKAAAACRWDGGPAWDPVKTAMRTPPTLGRGPGRRSAAVGAEDQLGDADRLLAALALDDRADGQLQPAGDLGDVVERRGEPDLRAHRHRCGEPDLVQAVVHAHLRVGDGEHLGVHRDDERQGQVAVTDRAAEGALGLGALDVHVDPLVVAGGVGEGVDPLLGHLEPVAGAQLLALQRGQLGDGRGGGPRRCGHAFSSRDAYCARRSGFRILPVAVLGSSGTNRTSLGTLNPARRSRSAARTASPSVGMPATGTTNASPASPQRASGTPMTA